MTAHDRRQSKRYYEREVTLRWLKRINFLDEGERRQKYYWQTIQWNLWGYNDG